MATGVYRRSDKDLNHLLDAKDTRGKVKKVNGLFEFHLEDGLVRVVRKYQATIKNSVQVDFEQCLTDMDLWDLVDHNKTDKTYVFKDGKNIRKVVFSGADDQQKLRGMAQDILYCNEANELGYKTEFFQLSMRTRYFIEIDHNPSDETSWTNVEVEQNREVNEGDVDTIISTFRDNPFLPESMIKEIERLKESDPVYYEIYAEGNYGQIRGLVFPPFKESPAIPVEAKFLGYGMDFGYTNDPTTLIGMWIRDGDLFIEEFIYQTGLTNSDIADKLDLLGIDKQDEIFADCAEPKSIQELCNRGYNVRACKKGADSIIYGIELVKQHVVFIVETSLNVKKEFKHYKWLEDKEGNALNKPIDKFNHAIDAIRYLLMAKVDHRQPVSLATKKRKIQNIRAKLLSKGVRL